MWQCSEAEIGLAQGVFQLKEIVMSSFGQKLQGSEDGKGLLGWVELQEAWLGQAAACTIPGFT